MEKIEREWEEKRRIGEGERGQVKKANYGWVKY